MDTVNPFASVTPEESQKIGTALIAQTAKYMAIIDLWVEISEKVNTGELSADEAVKEMDSKSIMHVMDGLQMLARAGSHADLLHTAATMVRETYENVETF